jgi:ligand-binding sensor domain-containing protein
LIPWSENLGEKLILYDKATKRVTDIDMKTTVICLVKDAKGHIWIGTGNGPRLIDTVALAEGKINFLQLPEKFRAIVNNKQSFIFFDKENNAWFYDKEILKITPNLQREYITAEQGLEAASLTDLFIRQGRYSMDRHGWKWYNKDQEY